MTWKTLDNFMRIYFGDPDKPIKLRKRTQAELDEDEDEELEKTPQDVIDLLGFDPKE